jgi:DNA-binding response OmpR family regulator
MPHALLLSPDDQAVSAITGVLEEMSVTCERPLDGLSAAQKLSSQSFDLVLVDCENLPAAKLIFDVCRRGRNGNNPVPIAIVDGRAGLPTAFRLGAELILTKPVAKDQARTTIRAAVSRVRKDAPTTPRVSFRPPCQMPQPPPPLRRRSRRQPQRSRRVLRRRCIPRLMNSLCHRP